MDEKFKVELNRFLEVGRKNGNVNEEDIYFRLMKYDASRDDINELCRLNFLCLNLPRLRE